MEDINQINFKDVISDNSLTIIDFFADWCMPCRMLKPILERVANKFDDIKFYKLDISANEEVAKQQKIFSVPTLVAYKSGKKLDSLVGLNSYDDIVEFVEKCKKID